MDGGPGDFATDERAARMPVARHSKAEDSAGPARSFRVALILGSESVAASGCPCVPVMQAADLRDGDYLAALRWLDYTGKPSRCQRMTVSGLTIIRHERQPDQRRDSHTQKMRSRLRSLGRFADTWRTASW
jgi:hypothetical protein